MRYRPETSVTTRQYRSAFTVRLMKVSDHHLLLPHSATLHLSLSSHEWRSYQQETSTRSYRTISLFPRRRRSIPKSSNFVVSRQSLKFGTTDFTYYKLTGPRPPQVDTEYLHLHQPTSKMGKNLLDLPAEIRTKIWSHLVVVETMLEPWRGLKDG